MDARPDGGEALDVLDIRREGGQTVTQVTAELSESFSIYHPFVDAT